MKAIALSSSEQPETLPIHLPARMVLLLRELADAADITNGADGFVEETIGSLVYDSLNSEPGHIEGMLEQIHAGWLLKDPNRTMAAMQAVVDRWNAEEGGTK